MTSCPLCVQGCVGLSLGGEPHSGAGGDMGFFFLSGDFYSLSRDQWTKYSKLEPAFNLFSLGHTPLILGIASLDPSHQEDCEDAEEAGDCAPRMFHGDNRVVQFNLHSNSWTNRGYLGRDMTT